MNAQRAAEIQVVLEGVPLPARRDELIAYARDQDPDVLRDLERLPDREFRRLDEVGDSLFPVTVSVEPQQPLPRPESGAPPGGPDYVMPFPSDTGQVRDDAPPDNPPQKAIEQASERQKRQQEDMQS